MSGELIEYVMSSKLTVIDQFRLRVIADSVNDTEAIEGSCAELGTWRGGVSYLISKLTDRPVLVFDTFDGIPEDDLHGDHKRGDFRCSIDEVRENLKGCQNIQLVEGRFEETSRRFSDRKFSFVHLDCDIYQTMSFALDFFVPRMSKGGIIVIDDYNWEKCPGVKRACDERNLDVKSLERMQGVIFL